MVNAASLSKDVSGPSRKPRVAVIGNFDGVHRGHRFLIECAQAMAAAQSAELATVLFDPHPRLFFNPKAPPFLLTTPVMRDRLLLQAGVDQILTLPFTADLAAMDPHSFIEDILIAELGLSGIVVGADFRFGKARAGDGALLKDVASARGLDVELPNPLSPGRAKGDGSALGKIGSSIIRTALAEGRVRDANEMLGYPWRVEGTVETGRQLGRTLGFPTANLHLGPLINPLQGVYAVTITHQQTTYGGVANYGRKPTVGAPSPLLEVHLFDFEGDLYGQTLCIEFQEFLREECKFDGLDALKSQIAHDCEAARAVLAPSP